MVKKYNLADAKPLAQSRLIQLNQAIRLLEGGKSHLLIEAKAGSGRSVFISQLLALAPKIRRGRRFFLDTGYLASELYEKPELSDFFSELRLFTQKNNRSLFYIDNPSLLVQDLEKHELRRIARLLKDLIDYGDCRVIVRSTEEERFQLFKSKTLENLFTTIRLKDLEVDEIDSTLTEIPLTLKRDVLQLAKRFYPQANLPGSALRLWQQARQLANQNKQSTNLSHLAQIISEARSLPIEVILSNQSQKLTKLRINLENDLVGQDHAVRTITKTLNRSLAGFRNEQKPVASFLLLGPSGVGKTEAAKIISRSLFDEKSFHRLDMSEFSESHTAQRLVGAPPGYIGYEEGGQLTNPVRANPYSLILLDEIEKAHPKVFDVFLQLLDDGRLTDSQGKTVDFSHTIVVATSNIGLTQIVQAFNTNKLTNHQDFLTKELLPVLIQHFRPEFLNRFDAIIVFQPLSITTLAAIARKDISQLKAKLAQREIHLEVSDDTIHALSTKAYQPTFGARPIKRLIQDHITAQVAEKIIKGEIKSGSSLTY